MKSKFLLSLVSASIVILFSCKKNSTPNATYPISGLWIGTYTVDQIPSQGTQYYSFIVKPDGKLLTEGKGGNGATLYGVGTWILSGNIFTYTVTAMSSNIQQTGQLTYNSSGTLTSGTWRDTNNSPNLSGTFPTMNRVN